MPLIAAEQTKIQARIDNASDEERESMRKNTITALEELRELSKVETLRGIEAQSAEINIEILTRLDATRLGKGRFYCMIRRSQVRRFYLQ